jgi:hypothetical protein
MLKNRSEKWDAYWWKNITGITPHCASVVRCPNASLMLHDEEFKFTVSFTLSLIKGYFAEDPMGNFTSKTKENFTS